MILLVGTVDNGGSVGMYECTLERFAILRDHVSH